MSTTENLVSSTVDRHQAALTQTLALQRRSFLADGPPSAAIRRHRIDRLLALVLEHSDAFADAMAADYGTRSKTASQFTEMVGIISVIEHTRSHLAQWMRPTPLMRAGRFVGLPARIEHVPLGVVGIIGPWNFPLNLVVLPASAAFAAGNRVMIKMSEITSHTAALMADLAPQYFDETELAVVTGARDVAATFAALPFDHLFFTGSPEVGSLVQTAAAQNLVPVTLELGGKNPVVVGGKADIRRSAVRIAQGRMVNGGQVCVCPDYVFVKHDKIDEFVDTARSTLLEMFPSIITNGDYCSVVNDPNFDRVVSLVDDARARGARVDVVAPVSEALPDKATRKIAPTIIRDVDDSMRITREEVFGPVLTVMGYSDLSEVIDYVNARPAPLVAYWFGPPDAEFDTFVTRTHSGGVGRNDFAIQMLPAAAPFGGVGRSGMGAYHGKAGFDAFSHRRSVVGNDLPISLTAGAAAPPFSAGMRLGARLALRVASARTRRRLNRFR